MLTLYKDFTRKGTMSFFNKTIHLRVVLIGYLFVSAASAWEPVWKSDASSELEVSTQIRAWTIEDEGIEYAMDNMEMAGVNSLYMVAVPHKESRPFGMSPKHFPHNPARHSFTAGDSRLFFPPEISRYGEIKPIVSTQVDVSKDYLNIMIKACRARGWKTAVEVSHYLIPKEIVSSTQAYQQKNSSGEGVKTNQPCPNVPAVQEYAIALFGDLAKNYDLDYIQTCQYLYWQNSNACFCEHCRKEAENLGLDINNSDDREELRKWSTTHFYELIAEEIDKVKKNPKCHLRYNDTYPNRGWDTENFGTDLGDLAQKALGGVVNQDHREQYGPDGGGISHYEDEDKNGGHLFDWRRQWLETNRALIGPDKILICGIAPRIDATPEFVKQGIKAAIEHPAKVDGLALKHYDGASFGLLRSVKQGMIEAGVQGLTPTIGLEVEDMALTGFKKVLDFRNDRGAQTTGTGTATATFDGPSNDYDIRISYFEDNGGKSPVTLSINGEEKISFKLDEDVKHNCWRWRVFKDIRVNNGDEIKLVAKADGKEDPIMEFIEFMPKNPVTSIGPRRSPSKGAHKIDKRYSQGDVNGPGTQP